MPAAEIGQGEQQRVDEHRRTQRKRQTPQHVRRALDLEGADDQARGHQIQRDHGQYPAVLRTQQAALHRQPSQEDAQKQLGDLIEQQKTDHEAILL